MNHKILTNQIMLSPTEGYLSPCLSLSLSSLPLPPSNKESLGQITPLHVVTFGAYISNSFSFLKKQCVFLDMYTDNILLPW
jgi:hypothetical protein